MNRLGTTCGDLCGGCWVTGIRTATVAELDRAYIETMEDVLALHEKPSGPAEPVVCVDEKPVSPHVDVRPTVPAKPGKPAQRDNEYGWRGATATPGRSGYRYACLVKRIVEPYSRARTIHGRKSRVTHFGEGKGGSRWDRLTVHYAPKHGTCLNQAKIELSLVSRQCLGSGRIPELEPRGRPEADQDPLAVHAEEGQKAVPV